MLACRGWATASSLFSPQPSARYRERKQARMQHAGGRLRRACEANSCQSLKPRMCDRSAQLVANGVALDRLLEQRKDLIDRREISVDDLRRMGRGRVVGAGGEVAAVEHVL